MRYATTQGTSNNVGTEIGAGEALRGTINSGLDGLGDGIAGRQQGTVESRSHANHEESVADKGKAEWNRGVAALKGEHHSTAGPNPSSTI
ncbi:hypothetical protein JCM10207_001296 [Rhodosporidiobolus poonsookiae]